MKLATKKSSHNKKTKTKQKGALIKNSPEIDR